MAVKESSEKSGSERAEFDLPAPFTKKFGEEEKQSLLSKSEVSILLDTYDDIFSDFDPRPYGERALSFDFLEEAQRAIKDKPSGEFEVRFLIPSGKRSVYHENMIRKRLKEHFKKHYDIIKHEKKEITKSGIIYTISGIFLMFLASYILFYGEKSLMIDFLIILLEPAGWFLFWEGANLAIFEPNKKKADLDFYKKMEGCDIQFLPY